MDEGGSVDEMSPSLKRLRGRVLGGSSFTGDPGRYVKEVSGCGHLSLWGPLCGRGESRMWGRLVYRGLCLMNEGGL
jgi:hypothetical protein